MSCKYVCDGCGKESPAARYENNTTRWFKPHEWFQRGDKDGIQDACSRECVEKVSVKTGKSSLVSPT